MLALAGVEEATKDPSKGGGNPNGWLALSLGFGSCFGVEVPKRGSFSATPRSLRCRGETGISWGEDPTPPPNVCEIPNGKKWANCNKNSKLHFAWKTEYRIGKVLVLKKINIVLWKKLMMNN